ncbi:MAG: ATP F0F1 synthase subunit alpha [Mycoplasmatales bacterium]|nr:ATP F0F1 synthase subunit alpha [Mycoplasmatales bacterium]
MAKITKIKDNIITLSGKYKYKQNDTYKLSDKAFGIVLSAKVDNAKLLIVGDPSSVKINDIAKKVNDDNEVEVYSKHFGSIITPFGDIIHSSRVKKDKGKFLGSSKRIKKAPKIIDRDKLSDPLETGILAIDTMIPIGLGQRELIIGDRSTGKSSIALNTIINQKNKKIKTIYVSIGQKRNSIISLYNHLKNHKALKNTIIIFANSNSSSEQFLAPSIGMSMAETLAYKGKDVLIIIDDLTKHANVYREISLSIGRNPGREVYPTDIFFQHSSLLERSGKFKSKYKGGSITALPIVETVQGDIASIIPSNIISITDGQIFTNEEKFNKGHFPAIDIQLSVSRTGGSVQSKDIKEISKDLKSEHAMLSEIKKFADLSIEISDSLMKKIKKWEGLNNILIQHGYEGYSKEMMIILIRMYKTGVINEIKRWNSFSTIFKNFTNSDRAAKLLVKRINDNSISLEKLDHQIKIIYKPLLNAHKGIFGGMITEKRYLSLKEAKNG